MLCETECEVLEVPIPGFATKSKNPILRIWGTRNPYLGYGNKSVYDIFVYEISVYDISVYDISVYDISVHDMSGMTSPCMTYLRMTYL